MSGIKMTRAPKLTEWLEIATAELTTPAKKRIRLEIEEHFAAAVENHTANGCPETDAQATALAELGDATAAAKHFRSRHLTEKEAKYIERMLKYSRGWIWILLCYAVSPLLCVYFFHLLKRHNASVAFPSVAGAIVLFHDSNDQLLCIKTQQPQARHPPASFAATPQSRRFYDIMHMVGGSN